jgi:hypothetical protein
MIETASSKPRHRFISLKELRREEAEAAAKSKLPFQQKYTGLPDGPLNALRPGSLVKVYVEAVGNERRAPEMFWVLLDKVDARRQKFRGLVNNRLHRTIFHGLQLNDVVEFRRQHIVDVLLRG